MRSFQKRCPVSTYYCYCLYRLCSCCCLLGCCLNICNSYPCVPFTSFRRAACITKGWRPTIFLVFRFLDFSPFCLRKGVQPLPQRRLPLGGSIASLRFETGELLHGPLRSVTLSWHCRSVWSATAASVAVFSVTITQLCLSFTVLFSVSFFCWFFSLACCCWYHTKEVKYMLWCRYCAVWARALGLPIERPKSITLNCLEQLCVGQKE